MLGVVASTVEFLLVVAFALAAILLKTLDGRGFLASVGVGLAIIFGGGPAWFVIVAVFFALGVTFTLYKYGYKRELGSAQEKGGARNWPNILANGGVASCAALVNLAHPSLYAALFFLGATSTAAADTVATELGLLSHGKPRLITHLRTVVSPGTSGGVTRLGGVGMLFASAVIGFMALALGVGPSGAQVAVICVVGGLVGASFDSLLGATLQRKGYCSICMKPTEALRHCGEPTRATGGVPFIENNMVNLVASAAGGLAALAVFAALGV